MNGIVPAVSWLEFFARAIDSVGWPLVALTALIVLRQPIARLFTDRLPRRVKAGLFEVEWSREIAEAETELSATGPPTPEQIAGQPLITEELASEARKAPAVAVLEAHAMIEREMRALLEAKGEPEDERTRAGVVGLARLAANRGIVTDETVRAVQGVTVLRNLAAHGSARDITTEQALDYLALVDAVLFTLRG